MHHLVSKAAIFEKNLHHIERPALFWVKNGSFCSKTQNFRKIELNPLNMKRSSLVNADMYFLMYINAEVRYFKYVSMLLNRRGVSLQCQHRWLDDRNKINLGRIRFGFVTKNVAPISGSVYSHNYLEVDETQSWWIR